MVAWEKQNFRTVDFLVKVGGTAHKKGKYV
jgi:hypothetical protein